MEDERRPAPVVSVRDPRRPERPADVLVAGDDKPPLDPAVRRRRLRIGGAALLVGALVVGGAELRERRAATAEERRLDAIVRVTAEPQGDSASYDPTSRVARLESHVLLRNGGPRDLLVVGATLGGYELVQPEVRVPAGRDATLLLQRSVGCSSTEPAPAAADAPLVLELRTGSGPRAAEVALPFDVSAAARACGFMPVEEAVRFSLVGWEQGGTVLELDLEVSSESVRPVDLVAVQAGPGLDAVLTSGPGGAPRALPIRLPQRTGSLIEVRRMAVQLRVTDCAVAAGVGVSGGDGAGPQLSLQVRDAAGDEATIGSLYPPVLLGGLLAETCPG